MVLKKDDFVYKDDRELGKGVFIAKVVRTTNTLAILENGQKVYNKSSESGRFRFSGESWRNAVWFAPNEKRIELEGLNLQQWFKNLKPTFDELRVMREALEKFKKQDE